MPERSETIAYCHACGSPMDVTAVAPYSNVECPSCGKHTRVKREFGPYTLVRRHAVGGMSMVFAAHDNTLDREVALKILSEEFSADERRISAFEEEARITASFSHPHVVRVLRTGRAFGRFYIAMELVPGGHFEHQIRERGKIPEAEALPLAIEVAQGLKAAHSAGLIHRDVKPGNILLDAEGHAKIVDFGLALVTHGGKAQATELWATPYYVPPETIEGSPEDFRSDMYAFGATFYHALAGKPSCGEETMATEVLREAKQKVVPLSKVEPSLSMDTCSIIERAMSYNPKDRFSSYDEMIQLLEAALKRLKKGSISAGEANESASRRRAKRKRSELVLFSAAAVVLLGSLGAGAWWVTRKEPAKKTAMNSSFAVPAPVIPDGPTFSDTAKNYQEARAAVVAKDFESASRKFADLAQDPAVQEPTRSWAGIEAVVAAYLGGKSEEARILAKAGSDHITTLPAGPTRIPDPLLKTLRKLPDLAAIPGQPGESSKPDAPNILAWMLAGLKNWDQGMFAAAGPYFTAVAAAQLSADDAWVKIYQDSARDYLADLGQLSGPVFQGFPDSKIDCDSAVKELDKMLTSLKTRGRSRYSVRAWQLDLTRHGRLLAAPKVEAPAEVSADLNVTPDLAAVMARLSQFVSDFRFVEAADYLKSLPSDPKGMKRSSLIAVAESSAVFLTDLEEDLAKGSLSVELLLKSGGTAKKISMEPTGGIVTLDASGALTAQSWSDFSPDALIALHRIFVKNPKSEIERLRRHQCAIAFDWLAGNRERALSAAALLSQASPTFKQQWETIAAGLPK
jgi:eukaryotic-like serine/threonine-protein kinase